MLMRIIDEEFIAFDLETTGLHPVFARIIEIGAVRFRGDGTVLDSFQQLGGSPVRDLARSDGGKRHQ